MVVPLSERMTIDSSGTIHIPHNDGIINDGSFNLDLTKKGSIRTGIINMFSANQRIGTVHSSLALFGTNGAGGIGFYTSDLPSGLNAAQQKEKSKMFVYNNGNVVIGDISANTNSPIAPKTSRLQICALNNSSGSTEFDALRFINHNIGLHDTDYSSYGFTITDIHSSNNSKLILKQYESHNTDGFKRLQYKEIK